MGILGACRACELHSMNIEDIRDLGSTLLVTVPKAKTKIFRKFTIADPYYHICKKYMLIRPANCTSSTFFLNYQNGKCTIQRIGINKMGEMGKEIAKYLKLSNPELYTGHSLRRTSATLLVDGGGNLLD